MNFKIVSYSLGKVLQFLSFFLLLPCIVAIIYHENAGVYFFAVSIASFVLGTIMSFKKPNNTNFFAREGFAVVALSWILLGLIGAIPFWLSGEIPEYIDALFEMVSGVTTTGASIVPRVESLSKCVLFWRSFSHWIGGMGVIVLIMAILPMVGAGNMYLLKAESSGTNVGKLVPKMKQTAIILYGIYIAMTLIMIVLLALTGMPLFTDICISFGTAGTGGFGVLSDSIASYTPIQQWIITIFMFLFGINFSFYYLILFKKVGQAFKMEEVRWYFVVFFSAIILILLNVFRYFDATEEAIRAVAFQVSSIMTTTGYSTVDYEVWPQFSKGILLLIMFTGACAGSTAGGIKISRFVIATKGIAKEVKKIIHPQRVKITKMDGKTLSDDSIKSVSIYFLIFGAIYVVSMVILSLDHFDFETNFTAVAATINNIGPGFGDVGPTDNFASFTWLSKLTFIFDMLVGRLEIYPMLLILLPSTWRNR